MHVEPNYTYYDSGGGGQGSFYRLTDKTAEYLHRIGWRWQKSPCTYSQTLSALLDGGRARKTTKQVIDEYVKRNSVGQNGFR